MQVQKASFLLSLCSANCQESYKDASNEVDFVYAFFMCIGMLYLINKTLFNLLWVHLGSGTDLEQLPEQASKHLVWYH